MKVITGPCADLDITETPTTLPSGTVLGTRIRVVSRAASGEGLFRVGIANGVITAGDCVVANAGAADYKTVTQADADDFDPAIAVCVATCADNDYTLVCEEHDDGNTYGSGTTVGIKTSASAIADAPMYVTATAGQLHTTGTTTQTAVDGIRLKTATPTTAAAVNNDVEFKNMQFRDR